MQLKYPDTLYHKSDPVLYQPVETTSATFVDTEEGVLEMLKELRKAKEIAVDLEHHDARSYVGLVSLMQISTREKDWIVDTLKPWRQNLQILNEVFADPNIIKVCKSWFWFCQAPNISGFPRGIHGYNLASERSWSVHCRIVRYPLGKSDVRVFRRKSCLFAKEIHRL